MEQRGKTIENLEDELSRIREEIKKRKDDAKSEGAQSNEEKEEMILDVLQNHIKKNPPENLSESFKISPEQTKKHIADLEPEEDDRKIEELFKIATEKGIINAVRVCEGLKNPHILDDLHRRLAHYFNFEINNNKY